MTPSRWWLVIAMATLRRQQAPMALHIRSRAAWGMPLWLGLACMLRTAWGVCCGEHAPSPTYNKCACIGCGATGDGDIHLRFSPCLHVVLLMRAGWSPTKATEAVIRRMAQWYPGMQSALVAVDAHGHHGAACWGWTFVYNVMRGGEHPEIITVQPLR